MSTSERNAEITRRRLAGERPTDLAIEFEVSPERIWQIVQAEQRRQRGEAPKRRSRDRPKQPTATPAAIRPRLRPLEGRMDGPWQCSCEILARVGDTPKEAYDRWLTDAIVHAQPQGGANEAEHTDKPLQSAVGRGVPTVVPQTSGSIASKPDPAITPVHAGQVQILPGVAIRKPLRFVSSLGINAERIGAQPPVQSLHGVSRARTGGFHVQE